MLRAAIVLGMLCPLLHAQEDWRARVQQAIAEHRWVEALEVTETRLSDVPGDAEAHGERARLLAWSGRWSEAEAEYRWVLARSPDDVDILTGLADVFVWQGRHEEALQVLNEAAAHSRSAEV
ncbi:MAG TPA: tetratricopeptide repeat protein, partial [Terriglobales bacterium]|nr:tetratricopeptide repeat protein [Terriglobales bacterium]